MNVPIDALTETVFRGLARLRGARVFHPVGLAFSAWWEPTTTGALPPGPLTGGDRPAIVRLSRGAGLPAPLPDVLGLAIKVVDVHGAGRDQDLLLASVGPGRLGRRVLFPTRRLTDGAYSSVLPYRVGGARGPVLAAIPGGASISWSELVEASEVELVAELRLDGGEVFARVRLESRLPDEVARDLRFDPWHTGPALRPVGLLNELRRPAYRASQDGRGLPERGARAHLGAAGPQYSSGRSRSASRKRR